MFVYIFYTLFFYNSTIDKVRTYDNCPNVYAFSISQWKESFSIADGKHREATIIFQDPAKTIGKLYRGEQSGRYYIENTTGVNYYYNDYCSAIRALYYYKTENKIISDGRN